MKLSIFQREGLAIFACCSIW